MNLPDSAYVGRDQLRIQPKDLRQMRGREQQVFLTDSILTVTGPSLFRFDRWGDNSTPADNARVSFDIDNGAIDEATSYVSIGNYVYLPIAGRYRVHNVSTSGGWTGGTTNLVGTLWENIDPIFALAYLSTIFPSFTQPTFNTVIAAIGNAHLDAVSIGGRQYRFRGHSYIISNVGAGDLLIAFGVTPSATNGHPIAAGATLVIPPGQVSGISLEGGSTAGTTVAVTMSLR